VYNAVDGMKSNSESRVALIVRFDAIQGILKNSIPFADNSDDSPIVNPLRDLQEYLVEVLVIVEKQDKRGRIERLVKYTGENADLKAFASKHLPHLQEHWKMAQDLKTRPAGLRQK